MYIFIPTLISVITVGHHKDTSLPNTSLQSILLSAMYLFIHLQCYVSCTHNMDSTVPLKPTFQPAWLENIKLYLYFVWVVFVSWLFVLWPCMCVCVCCGDAVCVVVHQPCTDSKSEDTCGWGWSSASWWPPWWASSSPCSSTAGARRRSSGKNKA